MDTAAFNEYLEKRYNDQMMYYEKASGKNKKRYINFQWTLIILSTLTTVLAALPTSIQTSLCTFDPHYVVVITAAIVTILTAALNAFRYKDLWADYRYTKELWNPEIFKYIFNIGDYMGKTEDEKQSKFVENVEGILGSQNKNWSAIIKPNTSANASQND